METEKMAETVMRSLRYRLMTHEVMNHEELEDIYDDVVTATNEEILHACELAFGVGDEEIDFYEQITEFEEAK